jgi:hypothetical protein
MKAPSLFRYKAIPTTKIYIILQIFAYKSFAHTLT